MRTDSAQNHESESSGGVALDGLSRRERFADNDDLVFPSNVGEPLEDSQLRRRFTAALSRAGLCRIRFHDLRHSFGTLAVQAFPLSDVQAYMGHADVETTMIYVHHVPKVDAADRLSRLVAAETAPEIQVARRMTPPGVLAAGVR